jgi:hypothetical protein
METLNLLPMKVLNQKPNIEDAKPITDYVKLKPKSDQRLSTLISNIFNKVFMVKDYPKAMQIAKEFGVTCVTPDL